ncbi:ninjurin-2-like [Tubulanus polymorphus]|uniref:ninjurin-2-like n=1 Tax=Tubulanus polymorphus TaxID=672921 RepID=UPI003DA41928
MDETEMTRRDSTEKVVNETADPKDEEAPLSSIARDTFKDKSTSTAGSEIDGSIDASRVNFGMYATKKTFTSGLLDLALFSANATQLRHSLNNHDKFKFSSLIITLICISILLQIVTAVLFLLIGRSDVFRHTEGDIEQEDNNINKMKNRRRLYLWNDLATAFVLLITALNVFIAAFSGTAPGVENSN